MRHRLSVILIFILLFIVSVPARATDYTVRFYDDHDGLSHWHISQILQDTTGMIWVATWNGLNRFDGNRFVCFKPDGYSSLCLPNDRIRRLRLTEDNNLQCLIEGHVYLFDTRICRFDTLPAETEREAYEQLKQRFNPDFDRPSGAKTKHYGSVQLSNIWEEYTDRQGNKWLYDDHGIYLVTPVPSRGTELNPYEVRSMSRMRNGDIWLSVRDLKQVMVYNSALHLRGYMDAQGRLQAQPTSFGHMVYCMHESADGAVLLGCKPGYAIERKNGRWVEYTDLRNAYDIQEDKDGRLWVATFGFGLWREQGERRFTLVPGTEGMMVRRLLFLDDGTLLAATTNGILTVQGEQVRLHQRQAGNPSSLSSNAIMCLSFFNGRLYAGTEGGGLNILVNDIHDETWQFDHLTAQNGMESDVVFELTPWSKDELLVQCISSFTLLNTSTGALTNYGRSFFGGNENRRLVLGEVPPIALNDSLVLIGPTSGVMVLRKAEMTADKTPVRIALSSIRREGKEDFAVDRTNHIILSPTERNLVMTFAAMDYRNNGEIHYKTRLYDADQEAEPWSMATAVNEIIMQDMHPGEYVFEIQSTNAYGHWQNNTRRIRITVQPTFMESTLGKTLSAGILLLVILLVTTALLHARYERKKRAETLAAYLELQERLTPSVPEILAPGYTSENERFLNTLHVFMEANIANSEMSIDDLAKEVNLSRSTLNRKMHELFNLSAKDFVQAARIKHACQLLRNTDMATKEVAYACGFSDPNYFSKCFKTNTGQTPTEFKQTDG